MTFGIIGAAAVGQELAWQLILAGHNVVLSNSRGPDSLHELVASMGPQAKAATVAEAANAPVVLLTLPWIKVAEALAPLGDWNGRVLVDATNIFLNYAPTFDIADIGDETGSEIVARLAPGARVVKAFNTLPIGKMFADIMVPNARRVLFLAGDDSDAKTIVARTIEQIGLAPIDLGGLRAGGILMQLRGPLVAVELLKIS
jgi:predicted dinucleotide-binding enzyme